MRIIIDTHIFLWLIYDTKKIKKSYLTHLEDMNNSIYLSSISIAEIMIKKSIGGLDVDFDMFKIIEEMGIKVLDFDGKSALGLFDLPFHHKDPFDRMIISQAVGCGYMVMSDDKKFKLYNCNMIKK